MLNFSVRYVCLQKNGFEALCRNGQLHSVSILVCTTGGSGNTCPRRPRLLSGLSAYADNDADGTTMASIQDDAAQATSLLFKTTGGLQTCCKSY